jgi:hypothetical protein
MNENQGCVAETSRCEPRPMVQEAPALAMPAKREIRITQLNYGYLVNIGCQNFAIERSETLTKHLGAFLSDPVGVEKAWMAGEYKI